MKRLFLPLVAVLISSVASLFLQSCTVQFVVRPDATPVPYPNAWHIELRVRAQINRISAGLQQGQLSQDSADVLAENDALVRRMVREYQGPPATKVDLDGNQTVFLDNMLSDNDRYIDDAFQRNQAWVSTFQGGNFDYTSSDRTLFIVSLDYQLNRQQADVDSGLSSGSLTSNQANDLRNRIKVIRELRYNDYRSNGRIDLSEEQVHQLSQMTEDNARYLRYRLKGSNGQWNKERFNTWKTNVPAGLGQGGNPHWGRNQNNNGGMTSTVPPQNSSTGAPSKDSLSRNPNGSQTPSASVSSPRQPRADLGQTAPPARILPTPTMTMVLRKSVQAPAMTFTPVPSRNLGQTNPPTSILAVPVNTPVLKSQAPFSIPTNPSLKVQKPVFTPTPKWFRPTNKATKVPVKAKPTPTPVLKKDDL